MWEKELEAAITAGLLAKDKVLEIYNTNFSVEIKDDLSPVTLADKSSDKIIIDYLTNLFPDYAFLTEESPDDFSRLNKDFVWIIDPLDGTKDFVAKDDEFTINIALCHKHEIVVGVIIIPVTGDIYYATKDGGSYHRLGNVEQQIHVNDKVTNLTCFTSVFHMNDKEKSMIEKHAGVIRKCEKLGSSIKMCYIAEGKGEISYRMSPNTKEWDTAPGQLILEEAGGVLVEPNGKRITYNRKDVYNRNGYIIANRIENILI